ncbi:MAG: assimilatory sulfite reductase (NADPH) flavoprotein subunit [Paludibacter sp.]|nr:assimilatory sulfite reductase (NADPH) flavoprotein subunit [Paludibacter sp.]
MNLNISPLSAEQVCQLKTIAASLNQQQLFWLAGYFTGLTTGTETGFEETEGIQSNVASTELTILYGSHTGNGEGLAKKAQKLATESGYKVTLKDMTDYKTRDLQNEKNVLVIVSTHGEGEPPFSAHELHEFIHSKRAPRLYGLAYAVLALGDSSYFHFCKTGIDFDKQLGKLGAKQLVECATCDVDFEETADNWLQKAIIAFDGQQSVAPVTPLTSAAQQAQTVTVSKKNPFQALVLEKVGLYGRGSTRQTIHLELGTENVAGLDYQPGDAAGVIPVNPVELINEVLAQTGLDAGTIVTVNGKEKKLDDTLYSDVVLSKITTDVIKRYLEFYPNETLAALASDAEKFKTYLDGRDIVDLLQDYPAEIDAGTLIKILRPLTPRYYSISSSPKAFPGEIHLTVGVVKYHSAGRDKRGTCSTFLSEIAVEDEKVLVFIESNPDFRLPEYEQTPIIMVGAGTGIAPYRAFVQHREMSDNPGKSWLFFGNRNFETEFIYQTDWQAFLKSGALTRMDVAFSRDSDKKVYVQDRLWENGAEVFQWLEEGAHFYICGDMKNMARHVQDTLVKIVEKYGLLSKEYTYEYVENLEKTKRLQLDVY